MFIIAPISCSPLLPSLPSILSSFPLLFSSLPSVSVYMYILTIPIYHGLYVYRYCCSAKEIHNTQSRFMGFMQLQRHGAKPKINNKMTAFIFVYSLLYHIHACIVYIDELNRDPSQLHGIQLKILSWSLSL